MTLNRSTHKTCGTNCSTVGIHRHSTLHYKTEKFPSFTLTFTADLTAHCVPEHNARFYFEWYTIYKGSKTARENNIILLQNTYSNLKFTTQYYTQKIKRTWVVKLQPVQYEQNNTKTQQSEPTVVPNYICFVVKLWHGVLNHRLLLVRFVYVSGGTIAPHAADVS
jgi:hypothetical protein